MNNGIYSPPSYAMGAVEDSTSQAQAVSALNSMKRSLKNWLKFRAIMDEAAIGRKAPMVGRLPTAKPLPAAVIQKTLRGERYSDEQYLADTLYQLLIECGIDAASLPSPKVGRDPQAAAKLAEIALAGKCPSEVSGPQATGIIWLIAIPVLGAVVVISQIIKSRADLAKERERIRCIQSGHCTDYGFWLKVGSMAAIGWFAWEKFGLKEAVARATKKR